MQRPGSSIADADRRCPGPVSGCQNPSQTGLPPRLPLAEYIFPQKRTDLLANGHQSHSRQKGTPSIYTIILMFFILYIVILCGFFSFVERKCLLSPFCIRILARISWIQCLGRGPGFLVPDEESWGGPKMRDFGGGGCANSAICANSG